MTWLIATGRNVLLAFAVTFLGSLLSAPAGLTHLDTARSAAVAGLTAGLVVLLAALKGLQQPAASAARAAGRAAMRAAGVHRDAAGIGESEAAGRLYIAIYVQTKKAKTGYADVSAWLPALRQQAHAFARSWGLLTPVITLHRGTPSEDADFAHLRLVILDDSDQADALGYHDDDPRLGVYARVFAVDCESNGVSVSSCASHELLEALADLACDRWAQAGDGRLFALEVCDPVEADTYKIGPVEVSSYVLPSWFDPNGKRPFDVLGRLTAPFSLSRSGYAIVQDGGKVSQVFGSYRHYQAHEAWRKKTKKTQLSRTARRLRQR